MSEQEGNDAGKDGKAAPIHGALLRESIEGEEEVPFEEGCQGVHAEEVKQANGSPEQAAPPARVVPSPVNGQIAPVDKRWKPGQSGNPAGRKPLSDVASAISASDAREIVVALTEKAKKGDVKAAELLFERIEGSVQKNINHSGGVGVVKVLIRRDVGAHG